MERDIIKMLEEKGKFVRAVEAMLDAAKESNSVDSLNYQVKLQPGDDICCDEYVYVIYSDSSARQVLATGSSKEEILKGILKEVYKWKIT